MADLQAELARFEAELGSGAMPPPAAQGPPPVGSLPPPPPQLAAPPVPAGSAALPPPPVVQSQTPPPPAASAAAAPAAGPPARPPPGMLPPPGFPPPFPPPFFPPPMMVPPPMPMPQPAPQALPQRPTYQPAYQPQPQPVNGPSAMYSGQPTANAADLASVREAFASQGDKPKAPAVSRGAAGKKWWDPSLVDWPENDFRIFVGDMGPEVTDDVLCKAFEHYAGFQMGRLVKDKRTHKNKGYGFVSFANAVEGSKALREMDGKYIGNRPCKLRKSSWQERSNYKGKGKPGGKKAVLHK